MMPMSALMMKMPNRVTASIPSRKPNEPSSPPIVPGSSVRIRLFQSRSDSGSSLRKKIATKIVTMITPIAATTKSPRMRAMVPRAMKLSKA